MIIKSMKRILIFVAFCLLQSLCSFADTGLPTASNEETPKVQQASDWEYLGTIEAENPITDTRWERTTFKLYVKVISGKSFYQVRRTVMLQEQCHSVSVGTFIRSKRQFNASFSANNIVYYFNL